MARTIDLGKVVGAQGPQGPKGDQGVQGPKGDTGSQGPKGDNGVSITSVEQTTSSTSDSGNNVITVTLSNGEKSTFNVKNGSKGSTGAKGDTGAQGPQPSLSNSLTSTSTTTALTAAQGKVLNDKITSLLSGSDAAMTEQ